jgi:hypothetical protein
MNLLSAVNQKYDSVRRHEQQSKLVGALEKVVSNNVGSRTERAEPDLSLVVETANHATRRRASSSLSHGSRRFKLESVGDAKPGDLEPPGYFSSRIAALTFGARSFGISFILCVVRA